MRKILNNKLEIGCNFSRWLIGGEADISNGVCLFFFGPFYMLYQNSNVKSK